MNDCMLSFGPSNHPSGQHHLTDNYQGQRSSTFSRLQIIARVYKVSATEEVCVGGEGESGHPVFRLRLLGELCHH